MIKIVFKDLVGSVVLFAYFFYGISGSRFP